MNTTQMKHSEYVEAARALTDWFESQDISGQNAVPIMCMVLGCLVKAMFKDIDGQNKAVEAITQMLHDFKGG